ncbi:conserved hypothetical protein [Candidatus Sulfopaludibacter sp. SbA6]|nr:conserved hypothetical protein [Candidatus Sulfopaludibacter sp. SbA6]
MQACYTGEVLPQVTRAGTWFLRSGIQQPDGGVARYYRVDQERNLPVSIEITGYTVSAHVYLHSVTTDERREHLDRASAAARFLVHTAWDRASQTMPFELDPAAHTYFFDCGIVVRGLLSAWRAMGAEEFLDVAAALGKSMATDFAAEDDYHPILSLPGKQPLERDALNWSRSPGCYQLKAAMAWWDLWEATGDAQFRDLYDRVLEDSLRTWVDFLPGHPNPAKVVDRLHAFLYFLEGLLPRAAEPRCAAALRSGIPIAATHSRSLAPEFERSDVYAQLLRIRLYADGAGVAALDRAAAHFEAQRLAGFQSSDSDPRVDGGYTFGRLRGSCLPHVNPVSTAFAIQALALWEAYRTGAAQPHRHLLI